MRGETKVAGGWGCAGTSAVGFTCGASRLRPVIADQAEIGGKIAFSVRAKKSAFVCDAGRPKD